MYFIVNYAELCLNEGVLYGNDFIYLLNFFNNYELYNGSSRLHLIEILTNKQINKWKKYLNFND